MKKIRIKSKTHGDKFALVDDEDYNRITEYVWNLNKWGDTFYAIRTNHDKNNGLPSTVRMHRSAIFAPAGKSVDHIDRNGLNNQKENLRLCSVSQNQMNTKLRRDNKSGYRGVYWRTKSNKWNASITINGKQKTIGEYFCLIRAAKAYDDKAREHFGEFASLNFKE